MSFLNPGSLEELKRTNESITAELREQLALQERLTGMERGAARGGTSPTAATYAPSQSRSREDFSRMFRDELEKQGRGVAASSGSFGVTAKSLWRGGRGLEHLLGGAHAAHSRDIGGLANASAGIASAMGFNNIASVAGTVAGAAGAAMPFAQMVLSAIEAGKSMYDSENRGMGEFLKTSKMQKEGGFNVARMHRDRATFEARAEAEGGVWENLQRKFGFDPNREKVEKELQQRMALARAGISMDEQDTKYNPTNFMNSQAVKHASSFQNRGAATWVYDQLFSTPEDRHGRDMQAAVEESQRVMQGELARREAMHEQWLDASTDNVMNRVVEKQRQEYFRAIEHERIEKYNDWNRF